jgi:hypothetical protein
MSDMAHFLGAKERQSFVAYSLRAYDYMFDTKNDLWLADPIQDLLVHYLLMNKY